MANSNVAFKVDGSTVLPGGEKMIRGWVAVGYPDTYDSSNTWFDLSNHLKSTGRADVIVCSQSGYKLAYTGATVAGGRVVAHFMDNTNVNGSATNSPLIAVTNNVNVATNALFIAMGPAY